MSTQMFNEVSNEEKNVNNGLEFVSIEIESIYIPHVFANISKEMISEQFEKLLLAKISTIAFVGKIGKNNVPYNAVYANIEYWFDNTAAKHFQEKLRNNEGESKVVYDDPWHWIVLENTSKNNPIRQQQQQQQQQKQKPTNPDFSEMFKALDLLDFKIALNQKLKLKIMKEVKKEKEAKEEDERLRLKEERFQEFDKKCAEEDNKTADDDDFNVDIFENDEKLLNLLYQENEKKKLLMRKIAKLEMENRNLKSYNNN